MHGVATHQPVHTYYENISHVMLTSQVSLSNLWHIMEYTEGNSSYQRQTWPERKETIIILAKMKFPLPTPILRCTKEVYTRIAKGAMGE